MTPGDARWRCRSWGLLALGGWLLASGSCLAFTRGDLQSWQSLTLVAYAKDQWTATVTGETRVAGDAYLA